MLVFKGRRKPEFLEKNRSEKRKPTTNSTNIWGLFLKKELQGKKEGITGINYTTTYRTLTWQQFKQHLHNTRKPDKYTVYLSPWCTGVGYWISGTFRFYDEEVFSMRFSQYRVARVNQNHFGAKTRWPLSFYYELQRECIDLIFVEVILSTLVSFIEDHQSGIRCQFH